MPKRWPCKRPEKRPRAPRPMSPWSRAIIGGETRPCAEALVDAGVARVVAAIQDPDPRVNGAGLARMEECGVTVEVGLCEQEARDINAGFIHRIKTGRPLVALLDRDELKTGDLFLGAAFFDAVLMDLKSWLALDEDGSNGALSLVVDDPKIAPADLGAKSAKQRAQVWIAVAKGRMSSRTVILRDYMGSVIEVGGAEDGRVDMHALLLTLGRVGLTRIACESSSPLAEALRSEDLV